MIAAKNRMKSIWILSAFLAALLPNISHASALGTAQADLIQSTDRTKTWTPPAATDTLVGRTSTDTLTSKTIDCSNNTCSKIPVDAQTVQEVPSGTCNGSTTSFTLANTPNAGTGVFISIDGLVQTQGAGKDYTISGATITLATACSSGQTVYAVYSKY